MSAVGFDTGGVDGRFGAQAEQAVKQLQQQSELGVDGVVGAKTRRRWREDEDTASLARRHGHA
jgi:peptidoglycan hydrolase-like protein with peptidoglycan-binding domain